MIKSARSAGSASELDEPHRREGQRSVRRTLDVEKRERGVCSHRVERPDEPVLCGVLVE